MNVIARQEFELAKMQDSDILISDFEHQSRYYIQFRTNTLGKGMNSLIPTPAMD